MKKLLFVSGTRADFNKISHIIEYLSREHEISILLSDMHNDKNFNLTQKIVKANLNKKINIYCMKKKDSSKVVDYFAYQTKYMNVFLKKNHFDMVFVHGDRFSSLATSISAAYNNVPICQIEAGDVSGSIDESIRHSITKFAHRFLVSDETAKQRVLQLGEREDAISIIGKTSVFRDMPMCKNEIIAKKLTNNYAILIYHPVTTLSYEDNYNNFNYLIKNLQQSNINYLVIATNNDKNYTAITSQYALLDYKKFIVVKNLPPQEYYYFLKNAKFIIGNSSSGVIEARQVGTYALNIGIRQNGRVEDNEKCLLSLPDKSEELLTKILQLEKTNGFEPECKKLINFEEKMSKIFNQTFFEVDICKKFMDRKNYE